MADTDKKKKVPATLIGALVVGLAAGAGGDKLLSPSYETSAKFAVARLLGDGQMAVDVVVKVGAGNASRQLVFDSNGGTPRLNGMPIKDSDAEELGKATVTYMKTAQGHLDKLKNTLCK